VFAITSLFPSLDKQIIKIQSKAISSWLNVGFRVFSCNTYDEINRLCIDFPNVEFIEVKRSGFDEYGKPFVHIYDMLCSIEEQYNGVFCIINSDIIIRSMSDEKRQNIKQKAENSILYLHRYDINHYNDIEGEYYFSGRDAFFLHTKNVIHFNDDGFMMGLPEWDHWMVYKAINHKIEVCEIKDPIAYHLKHTQRWQSVQCAKLIKNDIEEYYSIVNSTLAKIDGFVADDAYIDDLEFSENIQNDVYIDTDAAKLLKNQAICNNYASVKSGVGIGYYNDGKFLRVCALHGAMKELYSNAYIIKREIADDKLTKDEPIIQSGIIAAYIDFDKTELKRKLQNKRFIIYPAGKAARMMLECLKSCGLQPIGFADKNADVLGNACCGYKVFSINELINECYEYILLASNLYSAEIFKDLKALGIPAEKVLPL
jgi:hypothetical protein